MKHYATQCVKGFFAPMLAVKLLLVSLGLTLNAFAQYPGQPENADLWREWMSIRQREPSMISGPRMYLMTDREILQTSPDSASFQNGGYRMILADGSVPDTDGDVDGYTDVFEFGPPYKSNQNSPSSIPRDGDGNPLLTDAFSILMADGSVLGVADSTLFSSTQATLVKNGSGSAVRVIAAPASEFVRPVPFRDFSSLFYYYFKNPGQTTGTYIKYPLSLYTLQKDYPNPQDCNTLETTIVPGEYKVEFPTILNAPLGKSNASAFHRLVPNGSLTRSLKKPTWLIRSLTSIEKENTLPVAQKWVNGKLKFDSYLPLTLNWDNLVNGGLATGNDYIEVTIEDETLGQVSYTFRVNAVTSSLDLSLIDATNLVYGTIAQRIAGADLNSDPTDPVRLARPLHESIKGHIVMKYLRYANRQASADLSSVTVRVPIEMAVTYNSWRKQLFPSNSTNDSISGPNADPDGDGLTNQQEFNQASDPKVATIVIDTPTRTDITFNSATLGGTVKIDPSSANVITERGVVYSVSSTNPFPIIGGAGVNKAVWLGNNPAPDPTPAPAPAPSDDTDQDKLSDKWERLFFDNLAQVGTGDRDADGLSNEVEETIGSNPTSVDNDVDQDQLYDTWERFYFGNLRQSGTGDLDDDGHSNEVEETAGTNPKVINGFEVDVTGLTPGTTYTFKAYVTSTVGTKYTTVSTFTTLRTPLKNPTVTAVTSNAATLGATVTGSGFTIYERGVVYSESLTNPFPTVDGPGVDRAVWTQKAPAADPVPADDIDTDKLSDIWEKLYFVDLNQLGTGDFDGDGQSNEVEETNGSNPTKSGDFVVSVASLASGTRYSFSGYVITDLGTFYTEPVSTFTTFPASSVTPPVVTTPTSSGISSVSVTLGGNVTSAGNSAITERGVVYSPIIDNEDPFLGDSGVLQKAAPGTTTGVFTVSVIGLLPNTAYAFRAYAINAVGTAHTLDMGTFTTASAPLITSPTATNITSLSATLGGDVTDSGGSPVIQCGVVFSLTSVNPDPLMGGTGVVAFGATTTGTGVFTSNATGLSPSKNYSFKAYAINAIGTSYTTVGTFTTAPAVPTVTALTLANVTSSSATLGANVTNDGAPAILERGFIYSQASVNGNPLIGGPGVIKVIVSGTTGVMNSSISGLLAETGYVFKGYAINAVGVGYSSSFPFTTRQITVSNPTAASITVNSAVLGGTVSGPATASLIERGVVYSVFALNPSPVIDGAGVSRLKNTAINALGVFTVPVPGLVAATKYAYSAYVITTAGTFYSSPASNFTTLTQPPVTLASVNTLTSSVITGTSATLGGNVSSDGDSPITERGVVYSVTSANDNPFIGGAGVTKKTSIGTTGVFTVSATPLVANTTYSFRAYAINSLGTSYTSTIGTFNTSTSPTIVSPTVASVTVNSAVLGANLTQDGNSPITERGVVYSLTSVNGTPQINGTGVMKVLVPGTITGVFSTTVTGLTANKAYSFSGYAINAIGTSYTTAIGTFTTAATPTIVSPTSANITSTSATLGGNITSDGGAPIVQRGVVFSLSSLNGNPIIGGLNVTAIVTPTPAIGVFTVDASGLTPGKAYSYKAYAINGGVTSYTALSGFTTAGALATITSPTLSSVTSNSATLGANVTSDGAATITQRGFIYSQTSINNDPTVGGLGVTALVVPGTTGIMSGAITGLLANTGYTFKAYAINSAGTAYAAPFAFFTTFPPLTVSSPTFADVTVTTATLGGTVVSDGGTTVSGRGVVLTLDSNIPPVIGGAGVINVVGSGTMGPFTVPVTGLNSGSDYYFRAYATNATGTSYSSISTFTTLPLLLLGQAQMQWAPVPQPAQMQAFSLQDPQMQQAAAIEAPAQAVPQFTYLKASSETSNQMTWNIEISSDNREWLPINTNAWLVTETTDEVKAVWNSTTSTPPTRLFFRIKGRLN
ncbi:MAG: hypothetical protein RLZZ398_158 [Verrucomicrobiota bacterium]